MVIEILKYFLFGFFIKIITGLDDTITRIPLLSSVTKTKIGKIAFSIGTVIAVTLAVVFALFFSTLITKIPSYRYIIAGLIFLLAITIFFGLFEEKMKKRKEEKLKKITTKRFFKLIGIGFIASFITVIDDSIAYIPVLSVQGPLKLAAVLGIYVALILQIILIIYFAKKIAKFKYKKHLAVLGLIIIGILVLLGII